ncbi:peroxin [Malassezia yamatoensis]|uniref:Peroxin n=1 Tax=Malassezia yamatoensis TaxID=253288 RepID=A0AAJ5Z007_9BASI|nr:peroxin [Malassezia yamatoensis]
MASNTPRGRQWLRRGLNVVAVTAGVLGGLYMLAQTALSKFNEMQEQLLRDRIARENLRRRFLQNQEDCNFTIMALLPTLSVQIFQKIDVDSTRQELKQVIESSKQAGKRSLESVSDTSDSLSGASPAIATGQEKRSESAKEPSQRDSAPGSSLQEPITKTEKHTEPQDATETKHEHKRRSSTSSSVPETSETPHAAQGPDRLYEAAPPPISTHARLPSAASVDHSELQTNDNQISKPAPTLQGPTEEDFKQKKIKLWNEIKLQSFTRTFTTLYTLVFISLQTHIQLNVIGRRAYLIALESQASREAHQPLNNKQEEEEDHHHIALDDGSGKSFNPLAVQQLDESPNDLLDQDTEKKFLTSSYWFLHKGWNTVAERVQAAVEAEVADMPLRTILTFEHFQGILDRIRDRLESSTEPTSKKELPGFLSRLGLRNVLLPELQQDERAMLIDAGAVSSSAPTSEIVTPQLRFLLDETKDYIDSPDFQRVFRVSCDRVFGLLTQHLAPSFGAQTLSQDLLHGTPDMMQLSSMSHVDKPLELARILPLIALQAQVAFNTSPNEYVEAITESRELRALSVLTYTAWSNEIAP